MKKPEQYDNQLLKLHDNALKMQNEIKKIKADYLTIKTDDECTKEAIKDVVYGLDAMIHALDVTIFMNISFEVL